MGSRFFRIKPFIQVVTIATCLAYSAASVADIVLLRALSFGKIAVRHNDVVSNYSIDYNGETTIPNDIVVITQPTTAEFLISGYAPHKNLSISVVVTSPVSSTPSPEEFTLSAVDAPATVKTAGDGSALLTVGGTLTTSGSGNNYVDVTYTTQYRVIVNL